MTRVHDAFPKKNAYWTEGGPNIKKSDYQTDFTYWSTKFNGILNNWARSITAWNVALDEKGKPNIGPFSCGGTITIENGSNKVTYSGQYWAFAHYTKHVKRGARVIETKALNELGSNAAVSHVGLLNPDGSTVMVLANSGPVTDVQLALNGQTLGVNLPADSVITLQWA